MKLGKRRFLILALILAGVLLWANLSWAQGRGDGRGPWCQLNQGNQATQDTGPGQGRGWGRGRGNANCPNYPGNRNCPWGRGAKAQGFQGQQGPGQNAPNTPANPGNVTQ
jgi:hypothetical protein